MSARVKTSVAGALVAFGLVAGLAGAARAQFVIYEDFSSGVIDPARWAGLSTEGSFDAPTAQLLRAVDNGSLHLALTSWGSAESDSGSILSRQGLNITQLGTPGGSGSITGLKARVAIVNAKAQDCPSNPETSAPSRGDTQVIGAFFNDGTSTGPSDRTGDIIAVFVLEKAPGGVNRIGASVNRCPNATCSPGSSVIGSLPANPATFATTWSLGQPLILKLIWNPIVGQFTFTVKNPTTQGTEAKSIVYSPSVSDAASPVLDFKSVRVLNRVENCASGRKRVQMEARFDAVEVMRRP
jgi:hypothetical protein